tara:strand:+ start:88 stop:429 length:342 start_codon:yes stop_codon:yes gene_type:complete
MGQTIFQNIMNRKIPADFLYEDEHCIVIRDINAQAPTHCLIIPKKLISRIGDAAEEDQNLLGHLLLTAKKMAKKLKLEAGFRIIINNGKDGGETVPHLHVHLLGGRSLIWPPG